MWKWLIAALVIAAIGVTWLARWIDKRKLRYKGQEILDFESVCADAKTGDILLFHKTNRSGLLDTLELDVLSPMLFDENEFRHSGIILRENDELFVVECADEFHSGHSDARYLTAGNGIRMVPLETLLEAYNRDNGDPHFGIRHISREIPVQQVYSSLEQYGAIDYLKVHKSAGVFLSHALLPESLHLRSCGRVQERDDVLRVRAQPVEPLRRIEGLSVEGLRAVLSGRPDCVQGAGDCELLGHRAVQVCRFELLEPADATTVTSIVSGVQAKAFRRRTA